MREPVSIADWQQRARRRLPRFVYDYLARGAEDEACLARNCTDFAAVTLWPRVLRPTDRIDTSIDLFGRIWRQPFGIAPTGMNGLLCPGGDLLLARAAEKKGVAFVLSTAANASMESVRAAAPELALWLQLYVLSQRSTAESMLARAKAAQVEALVLTVDVPVSGKREADLRHGFTLPLRISPALAADIARHPAWAVTQLLGSTLKMENLMPGGHAPVAVQAELLSRGMDRTLAWDDIKWIRRHWSGPLLLKGILHPADARSAIEYGVDAVIVSNHGGRQLDCAASAIAALPAVVEAVAGRLPILVDSGVRRGSDVARALAIGASAVLLGRAPLYGLAAAGGSGVEAVLELFSDELERTMCLLGISSIAALANAHRP